MIRDTHRCRRISHGFTLIELLVVIWDFPNRLAPTATVGLLDDYIMAPEIDKLLPDSNK